MQLNNLLIAAVATLAGTSAALPVSAGPFRTAKLSVPRNETSRTENWPKIPSASNSTHSTQRTAGHTGPSCQQMCALVAQTCVVAVPNDEPFCWDTYNNCTNRCYY